MTCGEREKAAEMTNKKDISNPFDTCAECKSMGPTTEAMCKQCEADTPAFTQLVYQMMKDYK